jgi:hypothetical protein
MGNGEESARTAALEQRFAARGHQWKIVSTSDTNAQRELAKLGYGNIDGFVLLTTAGGEVVEGRVFPMLDDIEEFVAFMESCARD